MSSVLIGVIGVILAIGLVVAGGMFLGPQFNDRRLETNALRLLSERNQIQSALDIYVFDKGRWPVVTGMMGQLISDGYLKGNPYGDGNGWSLNESYGAIMTPVLETDPAKALEMCVIAREMAKVPTPANVYKCDGSNAPGGALSPTDPCCIG